MPDVGVGLDLQVQVKRRRVARVAAQPERLPNCDAFPDVDLQGVLTQMREHDEEPLGGLDDEANRDLPTWWFSPPDIEPTPLQYFLQGLFGQRDDPAAVMWSYTDFRLANPRMNTRGGVEFIGYHLLKMEAIPAAIALLEANARDHPFASSAAFELGRAYETAGRLEDARYTYERALLMDPADERAEAALEALE